MGYGRNTISPLTSQLFFRGEERVSGDFKLIIPPLPDNVFYALKKRFGKSWIRVFFTLFDRNCYILIRFNVVFSSVTILTIYMVVGYWA